MLLKSCAEQLRHASDREKLLTELHDPEASTHWDFPRVAQELGGTESEDISEAPAPEEWERARQPQLEWQPTIRHRTKSSGDPPRLPDNLLGREAQDPEPAVPADEPMTATPAARRDRSRSQV